MLLLIDFESTGVDTKEARITEVGAQLVSNDFKAIYNSFNCLVYEPDYVITPEVTKVTGITKELLQEHGVSFKRMTELLLEGIDVSQVTEVVAYNSSYDESLFTEELFRHGLTLDPKLSYLISKPWVCAMRDVESNYQYKSWKLMHMALEYGVPVNPKELHRAINDVELMRQMLEATGYTIEDLVTFKNLPWVVLKASVPPPWTDNGKGVAEAKANGYSYERVHGVNQVYAKSWVKKVKENKLEEEDKKTSFNILNLGRIDES